MSGQANMSKLEKIRVCSHKWLCKKIQKDSMLFLRNLYISFNELLTKVIRNIQNWVPRKKSISNYWRIVCKDLIYASFGMSCWSRWCFNLGRVVCYSYSIKFTTALCVSLRSSFQISTDNQCIFVSFFTQLRLVVKKRLNDNIRYICFLIF